MAWLRPGSRRGRADRGSPSALLGLALVAGMALAGPARAENHQADESSVKLGFLLNFSKFVEWPHKPISAPATLCVLGHPQVLAAALALAERPSAKDKFILLDAESVADLTSCHLLFIGSAQRDGLRAILAKLKNHPVLTVSDAEDFVSQGGMIGLVNQDDRLRFEINLTAANLAHLKLSSKLIQLALNVL